MNPASLAPLLQRFFTQRMLEQQGLSSHTVASYRDTFRLLLGFATLHFGREPSKLLTQELDVSFIEKFLQHLEQSRGNTVRTRNTRLAAVHSFFRFVAINEPALGLQCQRILAIPAKRYEHSPVEFLSEEEAAALVAAPDAETWIGLRDRTLLLVAVQTGLRNSELTSLRRQDVALGTGAHVRCLGKGRKMRCTPLGPDVIASLKEWLLRQPGAPEDPVFPSSRGGGHLSADAVQRIVSRHAVTACQSCPSLKGKSVTPHSLRHSAAMSLLQHGVDPSVIALWLGHESSETTQIYLHADMLLKERALAHASANGLVPTRYTPADSLLAFLEGL